MEKLFTVLQVGVVVRSFDVTDSPSTSPTCNLVRLHLTAMADQRVFMINNSFEHAIFKDVVVQIAGASASRSSRLEGCAQYRQLSNNRALVILIHLHPWYCHLPAAW